MSARTRVLAAYALASVVGAAAFVYPFWLPDGTLSTRSTDAPLLAGVVGALAIGAVMAEIRAHTMTGADVAVLGMLSAMAGLMRLIDLPGGGSGIFLLVILGAVAFGPRRGFLLGLFSMALSAVVTGGVGPWLPFQMLVLAWVGAALGLLGRVTRRLPPNAELALVVVAAWASAFLYGVLINLWSWPLTPGEGDLQWHPGLDAGETLRRYWSFYVATSSAWDAAGAFANAVAVAVLGRPILATLRRFAARLDPVVELDAADLAPDVLAPVGPFSDGPTATPGATAAT